MKSFIALFRGSDIFIIDDLVDTLTGRDNIIQFIDKKIPIKFGDVIKYCRLIKEDGHDHGKITNDIMFTIGNNDMEIIRKNNKLKVDNHLTLRKVNDPYYTITRCTKCVDGKAVVYDDAPYLNEKENNHSNKREDYISWDEYFMGVANLAAYRSKDPSTQVGACIVDTDNTILSIGYNGFPRGCSDDEFPWNRDGDNAYDTKYMYVAHAELNAILNSNGKSLKGSTLYVSLFPCNECAKAIIQSGIKHIIYQSDKYADSESTKASKRMLDAAGVKYRQLPPANKSISLNI